MMEVRASWKYNPSSINPFTIAFVYPAKGKPFVLKGGVQDVETFFESFKKPCIVHRTYWLHGKSRYVISVVNTLVPIGVEKSFGERKSWRLVVGTGKTIVELKRFPRRWIKQLDEFLNTRDLILPPRHSEMQLRLVRVIDE
jgi:hypothetical protein